MKTSFGSSSHIPLVQALGWIIGSALLVSGGSHLALKHYFKQQRQVYRDAPCVIQTLIQTGPQREALKTEYLAELMGISADFPPLAASFNLREAEKKLHLCPLISHAQVKLIKPSTLYVDYTIRQPVAWLSDYENVALDRSGYPFPFRPFFSPKNLPEIYFGLGPFSQPAHELEKPIANWNQPLTGKYVEIAFQLLSLLSDPKQQELFTLKRIDVSKALAESYGSREIIVVVEDHIPIQNNGHEVHYIFPKILRLSTKNYAAELGNFLKLREQLIQNERGGLTLNPHDQGVVRQKEIVIDFRIPNLAFIPEATKKHA